MKLKSIFLALILVVIVSITTNAQRTISDTIQGVETVNFDAMNGVNEFSILATQLGGTSEGNVTIEGSTDGDTWTILQPTEGLIYFYPSDTGQLTGYTWALTDGESLQVYISEDIANYIRASSTGGSGDTTLITIKWAK